MAKWDENEDTLTVNFEVTPTKGPPTTVITPSGKEYKGTFYNVMLMFEDVSQFLGTKSEFNKTDLEKFKQMLRQAPVKVYSNDPSFYYQGAWEDMSKHDATVFPFPGPAGDGVWHDRHQQSGGLENPDFHITKHMAQIAEQIDAYAPEILSKLDKGFSVPGQPMKPAPTTADSTQGANLPQTATAPTNSTRPTTPAPTSEPAPVTTATTAPDAAAGEFEAEPEEEDEVAEQPSEEVETPELAPSQKPPEQSGRITPTTKQPAGVNQATQEVEQVTEPEPLPEDVTDFEANTLGDGPKIVEEEPKKQEERRKRDIELFVFFEDFSRNRM
jgi:hypothetical protein